MWWILLVMALTVGAYLAGAHLARLWATSLPQAISPTSIATPAVGWLVPGEAVDGTLTDKVPVTPVLATDIPIPTPQAEGRIYTVVEGDTVWGIAQRFGITPDDVIAANVDVLTPPYNMLLVGQELRILEYSSGDVPDCSPVPPREQPIEYVVRFNENLTCLAQKFGLQQETILWVNLERLSWDPDLIHFGQTLIVPPVDGMLHTVAEGETLEDIAERYQVDVTDIVTWKPNGLAPQSGLVVGQVLMVPDGAPPLHLWNPVQVERPTPAPEVPGGQPAPALVPGGQPAPTFEVPGDQPTPTPVPESPAPPGGIAEADPFYLISTYDTGYCPGPPAGWGWSGRLSWPTDSHDVHPLRGFRQGHPAMDILAPLGSPVYAAGTGVVIWAGYNTWGYGNLVILDHGGGWLTLYAHLDAVSAGCGQTVARGETIGTIGQTGQSNFPHLHFEVRRNGYNFNPADWLP